MTNELKPCAHCAGKAERLDGMSGVFCFACHIEAGSITAWNRRAPSEAVGLLRGVVDTYDNTVTDRGFRLVMEGEHMDAIRRFLAAQDKEST